LRRPFLDLACGDFVEAAAEFAEWVWRDDLDFLFAEFRFALADFVLEVEALAEEAVQDFLFGDVGDLFALDVDDAAAVAREDGDVGTFGFARAVDDAAHDGDFHRDGDFAREGLADVLDEGEKVDLDAATGWAGDEVDADAFFE